MARLRSDIWVAAYLRRAMASGAFAVVRRKGALEAGAIFIRIDHLDGACQLYGPAPQSIEGVETGGRLFVRLHPQATTTPAESEARLVKEMRFDPDLWIIEVEDKACRAFLEGDLV